MRVLLTGHKGYIGSVMLPMLQTEGFEVSGLDNDLYEGCILADKSICGGISDIPYLRKDIRGVNSLIYEDLMLWCIFAHFQMIHLETSFPKSHMKSITKAPSGWQN